MYLLMQIIDAVIIFQQFFFYRSLNKGSKWPTLPIGFNTESASSLVSLLLEHKTQSRHICQSVPKNVTYNGTFVINTSHLRNLEDIKCDDMGSWINNGVRKLYLNVVNHESAKKIKVEIIKRGGKQPSRRHWCLTRTYFVYKESADFKKMIVSLQGTVLFHYHACCNDFYFCRLQWRFYTEPADKISFHWQRA